MKNASRPATLKQPRTVEVKTMIPWVLILLIAVFTLGSVTGWTARTEQINQVQVEVSRQLTLAEKATAVKK